jgi:hypothetical protein
VIRRLLYGSLRRRYQPLLAIALAATVAAGTLAAAAGLGSRLSEGAAAGLHASGPNLLVRPQVGGPERLPVEEIERVIETPGVETAAGVLEVQDAAFAIEEEHQPAKVLLAEPGKGRLPVLAASEALFTLHPQWEIEGPAAIDPERRFTGMVYLGARIRVQPVPAKPWINSVVAGGSVTTGEALDSWVFVPLNHFASTPAMAGRPGVDRIEVRAVPERLEETARAIETRVAGAEARPLTRVTATEAAVGSRLQLLMIGVGAVCLLLALATVGSATLALLEERRREIALFLSLGYTGRWVQGLLTAELALVGLVSVVAGGLLGEGAAAALARTLLGAGPEGAFVFRPSAAGLAAGCLAVAVLVALAAAVVRFRVERLDPAPVLQGR